MEFIRIPKRLTSASLDVLVREFLRVRGNRITLDFSLNEWVDPTGLVALSSLMVRKQRAGIAFDVKTDGCSIIGYWQRMLFFSIHNIQDPTKIRSHDPHDRFSELKIIKDIDENDDIASSLSNTVSHDKDARKLYRYIISEAINNICQHSGTRGFCMSQYYEQTETIKFAIGDAGIGLKQALSRFNLKSDADAVRKSLELGISGRSRAQQALEPSHMRNRGVGLTAISRLVLANKGRFTLHSGTAKLSADEGGETIKTVSDWPGVLLSAELPRDTVTTSYLDVMRQIGEELSAMQTGVGGE